MMNFEELIKTAMCEFSKKNPAFHSQVVSLLRFRDLGLQHRAYNVDEMDTWWNVFAHQKIGS